jgi:fructan beta-fructosidase
MKRALLLASLLAHACILPEELPPVCEPAPAADPFEDPYPRAHFAPAEGWMNDPCGLIDLDDGTHAFFQHNPTGLIWGNLHWGHAVTTDYVTWDQRAAVLAPDDTLGAPFSGTAILDEDDRAGLCGSAPCLVLAFTHSGGQDLVQKQSLAVSADLGATFALYEGNPVLPNPGIVDFRDPRVFLDEDAGRFVMVIGAGDRALVYHSEDLVTWTEVSAIGPFDDLPEGVYEVSDLFPLVDGPGVERWIFKTDILPGFAEQGETRYYVGDFDGTTFTPLTDALVVDHGPDFYAAQHVARSDPPRWMGWLSSWAYALDQPTEPFRGQLTVPRELALVGSGAEARLTQRPVLGDLRDACPLATSPEEVAGLEGDAFHLVATVNPQDNVELVFFGGDDEEVLVGYDSGAGVVYVDRTQMGAIVTGFDARFEAPVDAVSTFDLEVVVDRFSIELFADGGSQVISATVFPRSSSRDVQATGAFESFELTRLVRPARPAP